MKNPKYKSGQKKRLKDKHICYVCNKKIHFEKGCVVIPHKNSRIYRHGRCDVNSKAWANNKELNKPKTAQEMLVKAKIIPPIKATKESKRDKFKRLASKRTNKILKELAIFSNLSNHYTYEYTKQDINEIFKAIQIQMNTVRSRFVAKDKVKFKL